MATFSFTCGIDEFLINQHGKSLFLEKSAELSDEFSKEIIDGNASNVKEIEDIVLNFRQAIETLPMFGDKKVVWLRGMNFLADTVAGRSEGGKQQVEILQNSLKKIDPNFVDIIITAFPVDRRRKEFKWFQSNSNYELIGDKDCESEIFKLIDDECSTFNVKITNHTKELLLEKINGNTRLAIEETRKLATYVKSERDEITEDDVMSLTPIFGEGDFFEASEAFFSNDINWTLDAIKKHFFSGYDARPLITTLQNRNRLLIQLRVLIDSGDIKIGHRGITKNALESAAKNYQHYFTDATEKSSFNLFTQSPYYLSRLSQSAQKFSLRKLINFQKEFLKVFEQIINMPNEQEQQMKNMVVTCLSN